MANLSSPVGTGSTSLPDYNKQFRQAAAAGDTAAMIKLYPSVNIDAPGKDTGLTAVHRAAAGGHSAALRLLFNLGADFSKQDPSGKTAQDLALGDAKQVFALIQAGRESIAFRKRIFPKTDEEATEEELSVLDDARSSWTPRSDESPDFLSFWEPIVTSQRAEASGRFTPHEQKELVEEVWNAFQSCKHRKEILDYIKLCIQKKCTVCRCGDATSASMVYLAQAKGSFPAEELCLKNSLGGHKVIVLNRKHDLDISHTASLKEALIVDPWRDCLFFFDFLPQYKEDTVLKIIKRYSLHIDSTTILNPYPAALPKTEKLYNRKMDELLQELKSIVDCYSPKDKKI